MKYHFFLGLLVLFSACIPSGNTTTACELLGISSKEPVHAGDWFELFRERSRNNDDGWGVALYKDHTVSLFKEANDASKSPLAKFLVTYPELKSRTLLAHVRSASVGRPALNNTHPFVRELGGKEYVLAHNGTLKDFTKVLKLRRIQPVGSTDSEHIFSYLLGQLHKKKIVQWDQVAFEWLQEKLRDVNKTGSLNTLFSDGQHLFVYHDKTGYNSLYHLMRHQASEKGRYVVVATTPLTKEKWTECPQGQLLVFKNGVQVFPQATTSGQIRKKQ